MIKNNELIHPFDVTSNESGKTYQLTPNSSKSVQPVALLRLSVFTPVGTKENRDRNFEVDASDELSCMEIARSEGYDDIKITVSNYLCLPTLSAGSGSSWLSVNMVLLPRRLP